MKKFISILAVMTCVFTLTACSGTTTTLEGEPLSTEESAGLIAQGESMIDYLQLLADGTELDEQLDETVFKAALQSWENAITDIGEINGYENEYAVQSDKNEVSVNIGIIGSDHDANFVVVLNEKATSYDELYTSLTTNVTYSFAELMKQAALNTVLGMGTTFIVLILLAVLIYLFRYLPGLLGMNKKAEEAPAPKAAPAVAAPAAAPAASVDNDVLVAIQAAITAYERSEK